MNKFLAIKNFTNNSQAIYVYSITRLGLMAEITTRDSRFLMSPPNDFVFKVLFESEDSKHLFSSLLSSITGEPYPDITLRIRSS